MQISPRQLKLLIATIIFIATIGIGYGVFYFLNFRIVETSPNVDSFPDSLGVLNIKYNHELDEKYIEDSFNKNPQDMVVFSFESINTIEVSGDTLKITIGTTPLPGKYALILNNIKSKNGSLLNSNIVMTVKKIKYSQLSEAEKKMYNEQASTGETLPDDPIVDVLPHETDKYKISYAFPAEEIEQPATINITMKFFEPGDIALPATPQERQRYLNDLRTYTNQALDYLRSKNINLNNYILDYTAIDLRSEFPAGYRPS